MRVIPLAIHIFFRGNAMTNLGIQWEGNQECATILNDKEIGGYQMQSSGNQTDKSNHCVQVKETQSQVE